jgi:hypothetical protein
VVLFTGAAHAQDVVVDGGDMMATTITLSVAVVTIIGGFITPLLTAALTKYGAPAGLKAVLALFLTALLAVCAYVVEHQGTFKVEDLLVAFFLAIGSHVSSYQLLYKPLNVGSKILPTKGLGSVEQGDDGAPPVFS